MGIINNSSVVIKIEVAYFVIKQNNRIQFAKYNDLLIFNAFDIFLETSLLRVIFLRLRSWCRNRL